MACSSMPFPAITETPEKPPTRMPAVTAPRDETTKAVTRTVLIGMPASSAGARIVAGGQDALAQKRAIEAPPAESRDDDENDDGERQNLNDRHVTEHHSSDHAEVLGQFTARVRRPTMTGRCR